MKMKKYLVPLVIGACLLVSGCGSTGSDSSALGQSSGGTSSVTGQHLLSGRFFLGAGIPNATITVLGSKGEVLGSTRTGGQGFFSFTGIPLPESFRVTARLDDQFTFASEVRGFSSSGRFIVINVPTSLVSAYLQAQPGDLAAAERKVAALLGIPSNGDLQTGIEESPFSPFSHIAFFSSALQQGGWPQLRDRLVTSPTPIGPYLLSRKTAKLSLLHSKPCSGSARWQPPQAAAAR